MIITANILTGVAPCEVTFEVEETGKTLVTWVWNLGDGTTSNDKSPRHRYELPGIYTVLCYAWDNNGDTYTAIEYSYIRIYDDAIGDEGLVSGDTDMCFKVAVKPSQGRGITPISGTWVWPHLYAAIAKGIDSLNKPMTLVINSKTMEIFRIGVPELWVDREGGYGEAEIACEAMLPEIESRYGPHENVRHRETHVCERPFDEKDYRDKEGYDSEGFRDGHTLSLEIFSGGEQIVPETKLRSLQRNADYAFFKNFESRRMQVKLKHSTSAFRVTKVSCHFDEIDNRTPPQLNDTPEMQYQREFALPDLWFSRNKPTAGTNRASGEAWTGTSVAAAGPDGKSSSGFLSTGYTGLSGYTVADFTLSGWMIGDGEILRATIAGSGTVRLTVSGGVLTFTDGTDTVNYVLPVSATWRHIAVIRRAGLIEVYEAGQLRMVQAVGIRSYGGACTIGNGSCFDIRRLPKAMTANAMYFYYESVLSGGEGFLP